MLALGLLFCPVLALAFRFTGQQILVYWGVVGVAVVVVCMLLGHLLNYHGTLLRSHGDIGAVSQALMLQSVVGAAVGLALIPLWGAWGLLWGWLIGCVVSLGYARLRSHGRVPLTPAYNEESRVLLHVGFPIFLFLSSTTLMRSLDRLVVLRVLGTTQLGYYTLSIMAVTFLLYLPESVSYVLYPRLVMRYRESGARAEALRDLVVRPLLAMSLVVPALTALAYLFADDVVVWLLPKYQPGVRALRILSFGTVGLAIASIPSFVLITIGRLRVLVTVALTVTAIALGLDVVALSLGFGIAGVAAATLIAYQVYGVVIAWFALRPGARAEAGVAPVAHGGAPRRGDRARLRDRARGSRPGPHGMERPAAPARNGGAVPGRLWRAGVAVRARDRARADGA
jgi:O-antigen/teichoic acid export membrane protein